MRLQSMGWGVLLVAVFVWFFHESLLQGRSLVPADILHQILLPFGASVTNISVANHYATDALALDYPWSVFWQQTVKAGQLPLWNPYFFGGHPILAESMPAMFSPFRLLCLALSAERAFTLGIILEFLLTAFFMFAFLRELGRSRCAAFIGSCAWALNSGFIMWYWRAPPAFCLAPLVLLLVERAAKRNAPGCAIGAGAVMGLALLCGNVQAAVHLGFLVAAWWARHVFDSKALWRPMVLCFVVAVLISAVQWLPTLELMRLDAYNSMRVRGAQTGLRHSLLGLPALMTFVFPALTGSNETYDLLKLARASRADFTGYIGIVPITLALVALTTSRERRTRWLAGIIATVVVIVLFTPLVKYLYHRFFIVAIFAGCVLAAEGADVALTSPLRCRRALWVMTMLGALVALVVLVAQAVIVTHRDALANFANRTIAGMPAGSYTYAHKTAWFPQRVEMFLDHYRITNVEFWLPLTCLAGLALVLTRHVRPMVLGATIVGLTVADLTVLERRSVPQIDLDRYPLRAEHATLTPVLADRDLFRIYCDGRYSWYTYEPNWPLVWGIANLAGNASIMPAGIDWLLRQARDARASNVVRNLANVRFVFAETGLPPPAGDLQLLAEADGLSVYRNSGCFPRARWVPHAEVVSSPTQLLARLWSESFSPSTTVLLEQEPAGLGNGEGNGSTEITHYSANRVTVRVRSTAPGLLVLADTWYPGWRATVDDQPAPVLRADRVLRAVSVPAGEHVVEFSFRPMSFQIGATISLLTVAVLLWFMLDFKSCRVRTQQ